MNFKRRLSDDLNWWERYGAVVGAILATAGLIGIVMASFLDPHVNELIDKKQQPIFEAIKFNQACHKAMMTDEQIKKAQQYYEFDRQSRGLK